MKPIFPLIVLALAVSASMGCSMCCGPHDYDYPTYGGRHQRMDRTHGRIGSIFSDPAAAHGGPAADSNLDAATPARSQSSSEDFDSSGGSDSDADIEKFKKELDSLLPKDSPKDGPKSLGLELEDLEELPTPEVEKDPTARRPSRSQWQWR